MEKLKNLFASKWHYILVFIFGVILSAGVWSFMLQIMTGDDYAFHVTRLQSASKAWSNGQIVPQVDPDELGGFGYAYNLFYGPLITYVVAGLQAVFQHWSVAINLALVLCLIGSGLIMCYVMTKISKNKVIAVLAAVFLMSAPYALNNLYARMALGEVVAFVAAPILLLGLWQLLKKEARAARSIALAAALLVLSHSLSAMLFAIVAALFVLFNIRKILSWENVSRMAIGVAVALGLTAFFTLPMIEAKMVGNYGVFDEGYADIYFGANARSMNDHRLWPQQLVVMDLAGKTNDDGLGGEFGVTLGVVAIVGLLGFWFVRKQIEDRDQRRFVTSLYVIAVIAILVALPVVNWYHMPGILWQMQFPWRTLMVSTLLLAVVSAYTMYGLIKGLAQDKQRVAAVVMGMMAIYVVMPLILPRENRHLNGVEDVKDDPVTIGWEAEYAPMQLLCSPEVEEDTAQGYACSLSRIREKLAERGMDLKVVSGEAKLKKAERDGLKVDFAVENAGGASEIELPMIWYPGYKAEIDGESLEVGASEEYGMVLVTVPEGKSGTVKVYYGLSKMTGIGLMISGVTAGLSVVWLVFSGMKSGMKRKKLRAEDAEMEELIDTMREAVEEASETEAEVDGANEVSEAFLQGQRDAEAEMVAAEETVETETPKTKRRGRPKKAETEKVRTTKVTTKVLTSSEKEDE